MPIQPISTKNGLSNYFELHAFQFSDIPFNMNTQILIPLDDMTPENGATSLRPRSQIEIEYPTDVEEYRSKE